LPAASGSAGSAAAAAACSGSGAWPVRTARFKGEKGGEKSPPFFFCGFSVGWRTVSTNGVQPALLSLL
jgi:hypothetical protein